MFSLLTESQALDQLNFKKELENITENTHETIV